MIVEPVASNVVHTVTVPALLASLKSLKANHFSQGRISHAAGVQTAINLVLRAVERGRDETKKPAKAAGFNPSCFTCALAALAVAPALHPDTSLSQLLRPLCHDAPAQQG